MKLQVIIFMVLKSDLRKRFPCRMASKMWYHSLDGKYAISEGKTGCRSGIDEIKNERNSVILDR